MPKTVNLGLNVLPTYVGVILKPDRILIMDTGTTHIRGGDPKRSIYQK